MTSNIAGFVKTHGKLSVRWILSKRETRALGRVRFFPFLLFALLSFGSQAEATEIVDFATPIRGVVRASNQATLSSNLAAPVIELTYKDGESFKRGDELIKFDCRIDEARLAAAKAFAQETAVNLKSTQHLQRLDAASKNDVEIAGAQAKKADAEIAVISAQLDRCIIKAPYDGAVYENHIRKYETSAIDTPLITIIENGNHEIELIAPSNWLPRLGAGELFKFTIDETGETYNGVLRRSAIMIDPVSQTIKVFGELTDPDVLVLPGMSGYAAFDLDWVIR